MLCNGVVIGKDNNTKIIISIDKMDERIVQVVQDECRIRRMLRKNSPLVWEILELYCNKRSKMKLNRK